MMKKALIYLGLGPDEEYENADETLSGSAAPSRVDATAAPAPTPAPAPAPAPAVAPTPVAAETTALGPSSGTVRPIAREQQSEPVRRLPAADETSRREAPTSGVTSAIRIVDSPTTKPHAVTPGSFNEAQEIGDRFKSGQPVIVNLQGVDADLRRRLVDFASGLCYALAGKMDRVADQVYLLTPADVEVSHDDTRRALD